MTIRASDIVPGARIVIGHRRHLFSKSLASAFDPNSYWIAKVEEDEEGLFFLNLAGVKRRFRKNADIYSSQKIQMLSEVLWTVPVPEATDDELLRLAGSVAGIYPNGSQDKPWLLHVQSTANGIAYALPVMPKADAREEGQIYPRDEDRPEYVVGNVAIWSRMVRIAIDEGDFIFSPGALVVMWPGKASIVDGLPIHTYRHALDILRRSVEGLGVWLPETMGHSSYYSAPFNDVSDIAEEEHRAKLRTEPDEAIVFGLMDGDSRGGLVLGTSGITYLYSEDTVVDVYGLGDPNLGIWIAKNSKWVGEGESVEIESDIVPATMEDVTRFGFDAASLRSEVAGYFGVEEDLVPEDILEQGLAQALEINAVEEDEAAISKTWREMQNTFLSATGIPYSRRRIIDDLAIEAIKASTVADGIKMKLIKSDQPAIVPSLQKVVEFGVSWPGASLLVDQEGLLTIEIDGVVTSHPERRTQTNQELLAPLLRWLSLRPETTERKRPNDPRTIVPVRSED